ncbi:hypothetical protein B0H34DRAFT_828462 [Crassisporium funariophilum]|nr:hypothetical protein B0H34DRAFT_828462 [Crassisporium funariophilum]
MTDTKSEVLRLQTHRPDVRDIELYTFQGCDPLFPLLSPPAGSSNIHPHRMKRNLVAYLAPCTPFLQGRKSKSPSRHELGSNKSRRARHSHSVRRVDCLQTLLFFIQTEPLVKLSLGVFDSNSHLSSLGALVRVFPKNESIGDGTVMRDRRIISDSDHPCCRKLDLTNVLVNTHEAQSGRLSCLGIALHDGCEQALHNWVNDCQNYAPLLPVFWKAARGPFCFVCTSALLFVTPDIVLYFSSFGLGYLSMIDDKVSSLLNSRRFIMACWFGPRMVSPPYDDRCLFSISLMRAQSVCCPVHEDYNQVAVSPLN